ncbi:hypothetical protein K7432_010556 [Basidiobolus ranarum]|uniref:Arrestin-like N-terminal domain-containing protein n=1 Tax=Basidiobolus ranarum TaxID=34480 RepID=A0ABR2VV85_9FUNG
MFTRSRKDSSLRSIEGLEINLQKDVLTMHGSPNESVGCILRGALKFHLTDPLKVKSISLQFLGKVSIKREPKAQRQEIDLIQHKWTFLESGQDPYLLAPSNYQYNFELPLPGHLPESIEAPCGDISYTLSAVIERPSSRPDFKAEKMVNIQRTSLLTTDEYLLPTMATGIWQQRLGYCVSIPDTTYTVGDTFPVMFSLLSLDPYFCMLKASVVLREFVVCNLDPSKPIEMSNDISRASILPNLEQELAWEGSLNLEIPKQTLYDCETEYIQVFHKFFIELEVMEPTGEIQTLRVLLKVGVQSSLQNQLAQSPPEYQPFSGFPGLPPPPYNFDLNSDYSHILVI